MRGRAEGERAASSKTEVGAVEVTDLKEGAFGETRASGEVLWLAFAISAAAKLARKSDGRPAENAIETGRREREGAKPLRRRWLGSGVGVAPKATRLEGREGLVAGLGEARLGVLSPVAFESEDGALIEVREGMLALEVMMGRDSSTKRTDSMVGTVFGISIRSDLSEPPIIRLRNPLFFGLRDRGVGRDCAAVAGDEWLDWVAGGVVEVLRVPTDSSVDSRVRFLLEREVEES